MDDTPDLFAWAEEQQRNRAAEAADAPAPVPEAPAAPAEPVSGPVMLIDAFSQIFRCFFAIRQLNNSRGEPVNALYLMTKLFLILDREYPGNRGALLFDCGKVRFRLELLPEYKANRPPMPEALKVQMPKIEEMAQAFGWPLLRAENYEADDLIGGFACSATAPVLVVTSDKDLSSLVNDRVHLLKPARSGGGFKECDEAEVRQEFGVAPELIPDYLALLGDSVDNIAGVPGIGVKSAAELLNTFGPIESWYAPDGTEKFTGSKFAAKLAGKRELLERNLALTRLKCELPPEFASADRVLARRAPDWQRIADLCAENDFRSLLKEIPAEPTPPSREDELF
ncbi:MAG: hypothetical protein IJT50_05205 [Lentisphaeria bacterium]|nr:hypothetical protein [Lentisphaeria bacterium]